MMYKLSKLEALQNEAAINEIDVKYAALPKRLKGLYYSDNSITAIALNKQYIVDMSEELCVMAEELGHHYTSCGDLLDNPSDKIIVRKQETQARRWAIKKIASLSEMISAYKYDCRTIYEMAEYMDITESLLRKAVEYYREKFGAMTKVGEQYIVYFEPFGVLKIL